jgi:hypothetical protein
MSTTLSFPNVIRKLTDGIHLPKMTTLTLDYSALDYRDLGKFVAKHASTLVKICLKKLRICH